MQGYEIKLDPPAAAKAPVEFDQAINYVNKIKHRFAHDERVYKAFLEILNMYRKGQKSIAQVYEEVALLFRNHDDLLREFTYFLPDNGPPQGGARRAAAYAKPRTAGGTFARSGQRKAAPALRRDDPKVQRELQFFDKVRARLRSRDAFADFLKCLNLFAEDVITKGDLVALVQDIMGKHTDLMAGFNEFLMRCEVGPEDPYSRQYQGRDRNRSIVEKYIRMSISELDVATWERCTPSYVQLPSNYPRLKTTGRSELAISIINDDWVSVTSGSEDYSFKHYRKNPFEEALFKAEDEHFELDMAMDQNSSAMKAIHPLVDEIQSLPDDDARAAWRLPPNILRAFHYRAIQRIYGEHGPQIVGLLKQNPSVTLPRLLDRMEQKQEEWKADLAVQMPIWQAIYRENHSKSLDHRSFYWKQTEKKNLTPKGLVQEIRDVADRRRQERASVLQAVAARIDFKSRLYPHLTYEMTEANIHGDAAFILQLGIDNQLSIEATPKVRAFFHSFFEHFFGMVCSCTAAEERRKAQVETPAQGRRRKQAGEIEPSSTVVEEDEKPDIALMQVDNEDSSEDGAEGDVAAFNEPEEDETAFVACKPIVPIVQGYALTPDPSAFTPIMQEPDEPLRAHARVLYANESLYVLIRLYQILYDRLCTARVCAVEKSGCGTPSKPSENWNEGAKSIHDTFLRLATDLIEGRSEAGEYEDNARALLGTAAYQLFTLDKLVSRLVKQAAAILTEEVSSRLVDLWKYENSRSVAVCDPVHYANARVVTGDEASYRIEHTTDGMLTMQVMEPDKGENLPPILEPAFREYVEEFVDSAPRDTGKEDETRTGEGEGGEDSVKVYLNRNMMAHTLDDEAEVYKMTRMINGLECKLGWTAQKPKKICYVLGTEDFLHRPRGKRERGTAAEKKREGNFKQWLETKSAEAPAAEAAA